VREAAGLDAVGLEGVAEDETVCDFDEPKEKDEATEVADTSQEGIGREGRGGLWRAKLVHG
jgi:hypothetical protein